MNENTAPWWAVWGLAYSVLVVFSAIALWVVYKSTDTSQYSLAVVTAFIALVTGATGYYFGSSAGSDRKDSTIASTSAALATSVPVGNTEQSDASKQLEAKLNA